ncbi:MAG: SPOR domain-containing protein [Epsilonproteobacteria bacterium]|nr:SPOR domain-containing protein [Campylobacterota bacterium]
MKKLTILSLLLLLQPLYSIDTSKLYQELMPFVCKNENITPCDKNSILIHHKNYFKLDNNRVLLFFNTHTPNVYAEQYGVVNGAVIFNINGDWQIVNHTFSGSIYEIKRDIHAGIWVSHPWTVAGTTPALSYSKNGVEWVDIKLPPRGNDLNPSFTLDFLLLENKIALKYDDGTYETGKLYWITTYKDAIKTNPKWKKISAKEYNSYRSITTTAINNAWSAWSSKEDETNLLLHNTINGNKIEIPSKLKRGTASTKISYSIQIGFFNVEKNLHMVSKELKGITEHTLVSKKVSYDKYKLFLGSFTTKKEAQDALVKLRSRYRKNRYINQAFITVLP